MDEPHDRTVALVDSGPLHFVHAASVTLGEAPVGRAAKSALPMRGDTEMKLPAEKLTAPFGWLRTLPANEKPVGMLTLGNAETPSA